MKGFYAAYIHIGGMIYTAFMTNFLLALVNLPLIFLFVATDVRVTWLPMLALGPFLAMSLGAAFSVFERFTSDGGVNVVREFARAWVRLSRRGAKVGGLVAIGAFVMSVDILAVAPSPAGAVALPFFLTTLVLLVATGLHVLVAAAAGVEASSDLALWKACLYLALRRWYLTAMSMVVLSLLLSFIYAMPAWGVGLLASPILFLAETNCRQALLPIMPNTGHVAVQA